MRTHICTSDIRIRIRMNEPNESASEPNERVNRANWMNLTNRVIGWTESLCESSYLKRIKQSHTNHYEPNKPPHLICTAQRRYYEQPITHEPTASDERTNKYGLVKQHQVNFFRIRWTTMRAWTTTDRIGWNKQNTLSERWQILWLTNESRNTNKGIRFTNLNLIYKRELSDYVSWNQQWESQKQTTSDLESEQANLTQLHPICPKRINSTRRLANQPSIGQNICDKAST